MAIIRKTKSLETIVTLFEESKDAISAVSLVDLLRKKMNKTTIYRILERLESEGFIHSFLDKNGLKWYATCQDCSATQHSDIHPHFQCESCGKVDCLPVKVKIPSIPNREINFSQVLLIGKCEQCI